MAEKAALNTLPDKEYDRLLRNVSSLTTERASWIPHWEEISRYLLPRAGRFMTSDRNKGTKKYNDIYDSSGTRSLRILGAGLMSGATSPARPWFRMGTSDPDLMKSDGVKLWLNTVTRLMLDTFQRTNTYNALHTMYEELGAFGTSANIVMDDFDKVLHNYPLTIGEFGLATDYRGQVDTLFREFEKTVDDLVREFGLENCSAQVQNLYDRGDYEQWIKVTQVIEPRRDRDPTKRDAKNMPYRSVYFETGNRDKKILREGGMKRFRALAPRWIVTGGDIYGHSPGMEALGDLKQLQHEQLRKANAIDFQTNPPLQVPTSMKNRGVERFPGGVTYVDSVGPNNGIRSAFDVNLNLNYLLQDIQDVRARINQVFFTDVFMMLASGSQTTMKTATEIAERHEEKMLMLGPVLERLHNELLQPLVDLTFQQLLEAGLIPPPPPELEGAEVKIEFVSVLAQAQRAVNAGSVDRFVMTLGQVATIKPGALDKFNEDEWVDWYADAYGVDPSLIVPDAQVALIRKQRAEDVQAEKQQAMLANTAATASTLAKAPTDGKNALTDVMRNLTGYTT